MRPVLTFATLHIVKKRLLVECGYKFVGRLWNMTGQYLDRFGWRATYLFYFVAILQGMHVMNEKVMFHF